MKKNLSKNAVKSMAIGLAIAMGSSVAINGVSGNLIKVSASSSSNQNFDNIKNTDFSTPMKNNDYVVTTENYLFKIKDFDGSKKIAKAIFVGKATLTSISTEKNADGTNIPYKATLADGVLTVAGKDDTITYTVTIDQIGEGEALKTYTINNSAAPSSGALATLTKDEVNAVLAKATTVKTKAFDNISITNTSDSERVIFPATLTNLESKAFGGVATENTSSPVYIDAKAISSFTGFNQECFDKDTAAKPRTVNVELANHTNKKAFDAQITGKSNVTSTEKEAPTLKSASYDGETTIILTASEELKTNDDLADTFTVTKKSGGKAVNAVNVTTAKVESGALTSIKLTIASKITEDGDYLVNYTEKNSKEVRDANENKLASPKTLEFNVDRTAPTVKSVEVSDEAKGKVVITFDKEVKQKAAGKLEEMFEVNKTSPNSEKINVTSAQILSENKKVELTLAKEVAYGDVLTVSYTKKDENQLQSKLNVPVENFENKKVENKVKLALKKDDTINAEGYTFKVLDGGETVALTGKKSTGRVARAATHNNGTVANGVVSIGGRNVNVTEIGDGTNALTGDNFNVEELNNIIPNVTKIGAKAFDGKTLDGSTKISFPKVTNVGANGLGIKAGCKIVELPAVDSSQVSNIDNNAFKATDGKNSVDKVNVKEDAKANLQTKLSGSGITVSKVVTVPADNQTIDMGNFQFTILTKDNDETPETVGTVKLTKVYQNTASGSDSGLKDVSFKNGVLSGSIDDKTFIYNFTEIDIKDGKEHLNTENFAKLDISKVTKIANNTFTGATLPAEVTFPAVTTIGKEAFKNVKGIETLVLPVINATNMDNQAFGINPTDTNVKTLKTTANTGYVLISHITNKGVKIKSIETPSATTDAANVTGKTNSSVSTDITINISNEFLQTTIKANTDVSSWISNLPAGLKATVKDAKTSQITLTIAGTPTQEKSETINIKIPANVLSFGDAIQVDSKAKFEITKATSSNSGGGSSSGSYSQSGSVSLGNKDKTVTSENTSEGTTAENKNKTTTDTNIEFKDLKIDEINLPTITGSAANFSDVPATHWASESIGKLSSAGIIKGVPGGGFNANGNSKRADVAIMLTRLLGLENKTSTARFSDVSPNAYYANAVGVARQYGIINGNADGTFNPESYISRQDTMVMISRILDNLNVSTNADTTVLAQFSDTANISSYALEATSKLVNLGIINGNEGKINPKHAITRAEMAVIMDRVYGIIDKKVKEEAAKETTTESTSTTETTTSKDGSTTTTESTSTTETTTSKQ